MSDPGHEWERLAIVRPEGGLYVHDDAHDAEAAWRVALGWPSAEEIADAQRRGARLIRVRIREVSANE
jgi:hypothetical protein